MRNPQPKERSNAKRLSQKCIDDLSENWSGLNSRNISRTHRLLQNLALASPAEPWLASLHEQRPAATELYRDDKHGFIMLGHTEPATNRFPPHDHGNGWVFYAPLFGQVRMQTYATLPTSTGSVELVSRGEFLVNPGETRVFLPGDIHSTECTSDYMVQIRLTSCDISVERNEGRMTQYPDPEAPNQVGV